MTILKCKMCGGDVEVNAGVTIGTCRFCGVTSTMPKAADDKKANLYNRANHYRRAHEYDKARLVYESILNEDDTEAEAHWGVVLCQYGIEYVEERGTFVKIPMCFRMQEVSIFQDAHYKAACEHADPIARDIYVKEAERADSILKKFLETASKEAPYDVFLCYKETDEKDQRTRDSVLAEEIHDALTRFGYKAFFSRQALEGKHRNAFEPVIFAALQSSKAMVVVGTTAEHFNEVWVRNEWNRYLEFIKNGANKVLIPAYRDMEPFEIPDEFAHLHALDMSKIGFIQNLHDELEKIAQKPDNVSAKAPQPIDLSAASETPSTAAAPEPIPAPEAPPAPPAPETPIAPGTSGRLESLLKRGMLFLEDGEFTKADQYFEHVLDENPEEARAYWGKLLAMLQCRNNEVLMTYEQSLYNYDEFKKALRFSKDEQTDLYLNLERDREAAILAMLDSAEDLYKTGWMYCEGDGVPKNELKAFERFSKAAEKGYTAAEEVLGLFYENGVAVETDYEKAAEWYLKAADKGSLGAVLKLGHLYYNYRFGPGNEEEIAFSWFLKGAELGDDNAQCMVGACYYDNKGVQNDYSKAVEWFSKAAAQGNADAQYYLGVCYQEGKGVKKDIAKAEEYITAAAKQGHSLARSVFFITPGAIANIICPKCDKKQMSNREFCWKCGEKFILIDKTESCAEDDDIYLKCMEMSY